MQSHDNGCLCPYFAACRLHYGNKKDHAHASFPITLVGHVGDGNFHLIYMLDPSNNEEIQEAVVSLIGLLSVRSPWMEPARGEHGIGFGKLKYLKAEHGPAVEIMEAIKKALDPDNRMNPGKVVQLRTIFWKQPNVKKSPDRDQIWNADTKRPALASAIFMTDSLKLPIGRVRSCVRVLSL